MFFMTNVDKPLIINAMLRKKTQQTISILFHFFVFISFAGFLELKVDAVAFCPCGHDFFEE